MSLLEQMIKNGITIEMLNDDGSTQMVNVNSPNVDYDAQKDKAFEEMSVKLMSAMLTPTKQNVKDMVDYFNAHSNTRIN